jgi:hypothetical protein
MLRWEELTEAECAVWKAVESGSLVGLPLGEPAVQDPATGENWSQDRQIRAQLLYELLVGINGPKDIRPRALKLAGARITGTLDLEATTLQCPLDLRRCSFEQPINLQEAQAPALRLPGCHVPGLNAGQLETRGNVYMTDGFTAHGEVNLHGANVGGQLSFDGATLSDPNGRALTADRLTVDGAMFGRNGFHADGEVRLAGARIGGQLSLGGATLSNPNGRALNADRLTVDQSMFCTGKFTANGEVRLAGARIGGQLSLSGATLSNPNGRALNADQLTVDQSMLCRGKFTADGEVRLIGARIGGQLNFDGATLSNPNGQALTADGLTVDRAMFGRNGFHADGEVRLIGAHIDGELNFDGATLTNRDGLALALQQARAVRLILRLKAPPEGQISLIDAHVGVLVDNQASWPNRLHLDGFIYDALNETPLITAEARLDWLTRGQQPYTPQPYEQLAAVYRRAGRDQDARTVAIAKQRRRRASLNLPSKAWNSLLRWTVGYGYRPWQAGLWLLALWLVGTLIFDRTHANGLVTPAKKPEELQHFNPLVYALDVLLPIVNLGQEGGWVPHRFAAVTFWLLALAGWVLTTAVVAALTGLIKRD